MRMRPFGRCGFEVSELGLGTWGLSGDSYGRMADAMVDRVIDRAVEHGITLFETADVYGAGTIEQRLGERLDPENSCIVTKIGTFLDDDVACKRFDRDSLQRAFDASQKRLNREKLDVVLLHCPSVTAMEAGEATAFLRECVEQERLRAWGVSAGSVPVATAAVDEGANVVELAYNLFMQKDLHALADAFASTETAVLARSILAHGLLTGYWRSDRTFASDDHRSERWTRDGLKYRVAQLEALRPLLGSEVATLRAVAVRFVLSNYLVSSAVLGARTVLQLDQLVREVTDGDPYLDDTILAELPERLRAVGVEV